MTHDFPFVSCLCPTYRRPDLLMKSMFMFLSQTYPASRRELVVIDDSPEPLIQIEYGEGLPHGIQYHWVTDRFRTLTSKFNTIASIAAGEVLCVWEDDDDYLPWHIQVHVDALKKHCFGFSKPSEVLSDYPNPGATITEKSDGRFHASMAFTRSLYDKINGWPETKRPDFDQMMIQKLTKYGELVDPCKLAPPSYKFRWHTGHYHGQNTMDRGAEDETWYDRVLNSG